MLIDILFYSLKFYNYNKSIAFTTGFIFGSVGFIYIWNGFENLLAIINKREKVE